MNYDLRVSSPHFQGQAPLVPVHADEQLQNGQEVELLTDFVRGFFASRKTHARLPPALPDGMGPDLELGLMAPRAPKHLAKL